MVSPDESKVTYSCRLRRCVYLTCSVTLKTTTKTSTITHRVEGTDGGCQRHQRLQSFWRFREKITLH